MLTASGALVALHDRRIVLIAGGIAKPPERNLAMYALCRGRDHEREGKCAAKVRTGVRWKRNGPYGDVLVHVVCIFGG